MGVVVLHIRRIPMITIAMCWRRSQNTDSSIDVSRRPALRCRVRTKSKSVHWVYGRNKSCRGVRSRLVLRGTAAPGRLLDSVELLCSCCELRCAPRFGEGVVRRTIQLSTRVRWQIAECTASRRKSFRHVSKEMWTSFVISGPPLEWKLQEAWRDTL